MKKNIINNWLKVLFGILVILGLVTMVRDLSQNSLVGGQITKQVFVAESARNLAEGRSVGPFPYRTFLEVYHQEPIPWIDEFPLYPTLISYLHQLTGIPIIIAGRILSFLFFLILLYGGMRLGKNLEGRWGYQKTSWTIPLSLFLFPVFRIYGVSLTPDLPMVALCLWGILLSLEDKWGKCALVMLVAPLFKYYAVFTTFALMGIIFLKIFLEKNISRDMKMIYWRRFLLLGLSALPAFLFFAYLLTGKVSNPIFDYRSIGHNGHFSTFAKLLSGTFYSRMVTWVLVKNPSPIGSLLSFLGLGLLWQRRKNHLLGQEEMIYYGMLVLSTIVFMIIFANGFYIHDYYGIQLALTMGIWAALGIEFLLTRKKVTKDGFSAILFVSFISFFVISFQMTKSALFPQDFYKRIADKMEEVIPNNEKVLVVSDGSTEASLFHARREGWILPYRDFDRFKDSDLLKNLFSEHKVQKVVFYFFGAEALGRYQHVQESLLKIVDDNDNGHEHESKVIWQEKIPSSHRKIPEVDFWIMQISGT